MNFVRNGRRFAPPPGVRGNLDGHDCGSPGRWVAAGMFLALAVLGTPAGVAAQQNEVCLACHASAAMFAGQPNPSRFVVRPDVYDASVHGTAGVVCVMCHAGMEFPHPEERPEVDCALCHGEVARRQAESLHGQAAARGDTLAPRCPDCHGVHDIRRHTDPAASTNITNIPFLCGECHHEGTAVSRMRDIPQERILENYSLSIHGTGFFQQGLTVTAVCTSCHTSHFILPHTDPRSSIYPDNVAATCTTCHARIEQVHRQVIEGRLWETEPHKIPVCVECHSPHQIRNVFYDAGAANRDCLRCHADSSLTMERDGETVSLYVDEDTYAASDHTGTACAQCHSDVTVSLIRPCETATASSVDCAVCHAVVVEQYQTSTHGTLVAEGDTDAPTCQDCHAKHGELDHDLPASPTFPRNVPELCAKCHRQGEVAAERIGAGHAGIVQSYEMSIHGTGLMESGLVVTATCSSCHSAHGELPPEDARSTVNQNNVADTCGNCHNGIEEAFKTSVHWPGNDNGERRDELPACNDCHTSHTISRTDRGDFRLMMMDQCGRCHEAEAETFFDTFHGKVSRLGDAQAAKCYDCHGTHDILPPTELQSTLSRRNIVETCSQCHPGATLRFTGYLTHATHHDPHRYPFLFWAFWAMTALLVGTLTFALLHTLAWLWRLARTPEVWKRHKVKAGDKVYRRFTRFQRRLHLVMLVSFFTLALTGMVLKFSYMGWAQKLSRVLGGFVSTGFLHRTAAVLLIGVFLTHLWDVHRQKKASGKTWPQFIFGPDSAVFNLTDVKEFLGSVKWFFGRGARPRYGRYTYWEKFDYFAVFWGMFVIGSTGLILWFPEFFTLALPGWMVNVVTIIHSDEALLAVGFIFTVHFFNTHFRLDKLPMDPVIFTGRVPLEELKRDKPREYERMVQEGRLEQHLVKPYDRNKELRWKIFGFTALGVGLTLIFLIVYSMLFGYR
jgi:cytochrome b subunit of formate dehydrogenase